MLILSFYLWQRPIGISDKRPFPSCVFSPVDVFISKIRCLLPFIFSLPFDLLLQCSGSLDHWHFSNEYLLSIIRAEHFILINKTDLVLATLEFII